MPVNTAFAQVSAGDSDWINAYALFGADLTGANDSYLAIQNALDAASPGQVVYLPAGIYKTTVMPVIPAGVSLVGPSRTMAYPGGNYGIGGVPIQGAILKPAGSLAAAIQFASSGSTQLGNQAIRRITIDGSGITGGTGHGILADAVAGITLEDVSVFSCQGDGLHGVAVSGTGSHPPDFWSLTRCKFSGNGGWGVNIAGMADTFMTDSEATGNGTGGWNIINSNNLRMVASKAEFNVGPGYLFTAQSGFGGLVHALSCTSQFNTQDGFRVTGPGTPIYNFMNCASDTDGTNGGSGGGGFAGLNVTSFAGTVVADQFVTRVTGSPASPQYGVSMTSSNKLILTNAVLNGATAPSHNGGGNTLFQVGAGTDWINAVLAYGADLSGSNDATIPIQNALSAAQPGQVVYLPAGLYKTTAPLAPPPGVTLRGAGGWPSPSQDAGAVIVPAASFSGSAVIAMTCASGGPVIGAQICDLGIDGSALGGTVAGITGTGNVTNAVIENVFIYKVSGAGIDPTISNSTGSPHGWHVNHVRVDSAGGNGINVGGHTDSQWYDVHAINSGGHGWSVAGSPANSRFVGCRAEWSGAGKDGFHVVSTWNSGTGSGGCVFLGCTTDRNDNHGMNITATGSVPILLSGCVFRRDGRNGASGGGSFAGLNINGSTCPVIVSGCSVFPGVDDNGTGTNSPQIGLSITGASDVQVESGYIQGATTAYNDGGGNSGVTIGPLVITGTGTTSAPTVQPTPFLAALNAASLQIKKPTASGGILQVTNSTSGPSGANVQIHSAAAGDNALALDVTGDGASRFKLDSGGGAYWGGGGTTQDAKLARSAASKLSLTDNSVGSTPQLSLETSVSSAGVALLAILNHAAADLAAAISVSGDSSSRLRVDSNGQIKWGPGNATQDSVLERTGSAAMRFTGTALTVGGALTASSGASMNGQALTSLANGAAATDAAAFGQVPVLPTPAQMGIVAWDYPSILAMGGTAAALSGTVYLMRVPLYGASVTVTNILIAIQTQGSGLTSSENFLGLYDNTGTKIGGTADQTASWGSTGLKTAGLVSGPFTGTWPFVYVVFVSNGTTPPALARIGGGSSVSILSALSSSGSNMPFATNGTGTALPGSLVYSSNSVSNCQPLWVGLS
jgi:hypothetical protein